MFRLNLFVKLASFNQKRFLSDIHFYPQYNSLQSLDKLYSNKTTDIPLVDLTKSFENGQFTGFIPMDSLKISYCSDLNRSNTKVSIQLKLETTDWIPTDVKNRLYDLHNNSISKDGYWSINSDKTHQQIMNLADCMDKMRCYIAEATIEPKGQISFETLEMIKTKRENAAIDKLKVTIDSIKHDI